MHSALVYYRNCHCKTLFKISQHGGTARCAGVFKTCSCGDDRISRDLNPDHGILGKQGSDRSYRDEVESGTDFCSLHDITSKSENESNMGDDSGRSDESGNITHLKVDEREKYAGKNKKCGKIKRGTKMGEKTIEKNAVTEGVIWKQLLIFFFPIMLGTLIQQLYTTVDTIIVGRFVGKAALASVGGPAAVLSTIVEIGRAHV